MSSRVAVCSHANDTRAPRRIDDAISDARTLLIVRIYDILLSQMYDYFITYFNFPIIEFNDKEASRAEMPFHNTFTAASVDTKYVLISALCSNHKVIKSLFRCIR